MAAAVIADRKHKHLIFFYRSDCPYTPSTKGNMAMLLDGIKRDRPDIKIHEVYDSAIHEWRKALGINAQELKGVPAVLFYYRGSRRWFWARNAPFSVQQAHLDQLLATLSKHHTERSAGTSPVFLTYYFNKTMRHDPVHIATVGGLMLLSKMKGMPVAYRPVPGTQMHGVLVAHGNPDRTYRGHAAAAYVSLLLEAHDRFTSSSSSGRKRVYGERLAGAEVAAAGSWADYLTGFTVVAALLA